MNFIKRGVFILKNTCPPLCFGLSPAYQYRA